jgi:hypothetical protein
VRDILLAGHYYPEVGRAMEDDFADLLDRLGYSVLRKRDLRLNLDIIATFDGRPVKPSFSNECILLKPPFAPQGVTAFSLKRGDFTDPDIDELIDKAKKAKTTDDDTLKSVTGAVIVTNYTKTEGELDKLLSKGVYCWDGRRLIFYAAKARTVAELWSRGPVKEAAVEGSTNCTYLVEKETLPRALLTNIAVFIDDHNQKLMIAFEQAKSILSNIYHRSIKPIVESSQMDVQAVVKIHVLGIAEAELIGKAYNEYAQDLQLHPQVTFSAGPKVFQYASAPWTAVIQL